MTAPPRRTFRRWLGWAIGIVVVLALAGAVTTERVGAHAIVDAPNAAAPPPPGDGHELRIQVGPPAAALAVRLEEPRLPPRATVFVLHGIRDHKESLEYWAERLTTAGYRAVLVDSRGQGHSTGQWLTYGVLEAQDLSQLVDALGITGPIAVMGVSYGGATALEWAGRDRRVAAAVAVAPFASLRDIVPVYQRREIPLFGALMPAALTRRTIDTAGRMAGFDPDQASPADAAGHAAAPILIVHGKNDTTVPFAQSEAIVARAGAARVNLVPLDGQDHDHIAGDPRLWPVVLDFFAGVFK
jgi:alpha-beta hydrolase superfamily lysophospholipase